MSLGVLNNTHILKETLSISLFLYLGTAYFSFAIPNILLGVIIAVFILIFVSSKKELQFSKSNWIKYALLTTPFILTLISVLMSQEIEIGSKYLFRRLPILIIPFIIIFLKFENATLKNGAKTFVLASIIATLITCYNAIRYFNEDILFKTQFSHFITIIQHPYFGVFVLTALVLVLELELIKNRRFKGIVSFLFIVGILLSISRLVYILFLVYTAYKLYKNLPKKWFLGFSLVIGVLVIVFLSVNPRVINKFKSTVDYKNSPRLQIWNNSLQVIEAQEAYVFGIGIGDYYKNKKDPYFAFGKNEGLIYGLNPHSQPVEFYVTNGFLGIITLIITIIITLWKYLRKQKEWAIFIFSMVLLFSITECVFTRQYGVQLYVLLIPLCLNQNFEKLKS
nr:O-antigen ligase family protein [uncultured Psychroserpens sp.]